MSLSAAAGAAARAAQERQVMERLSREVFALDLSTGEGRGAAEAFMSGTLSHLQALGSPIVVGGAR